MTHYQHLRWWQWALSAALLHIASLAFVVEIGQHRGAALYQHVLDALHAADRPTTLVEYKALAPPIDEKLQDEWMAWSSRFNSFEKNLDYSETKEWSDWLFGRRSQPPEKTFANLELFRPIIADARAILKRGPHLLSTFVWVARDLPTGKQSIDESDYNSFVQSFPNLLIILVVAEYLRRDALIAAEPADTLADFDRLILGLSCPGTIIDAAIAMAIEDIRNRCYIEWAMVGRLPADSRDRWLAEPAREMSHMAGAYRGERMLLIPYLFSKYSRFLPIIATGEDRSTWSSLLAWPTRLQDCAFEADIYARMEAHLRDAATAPSFDVADIAAKLAAIGGFAQNLPVWFNFAYEADAEPRLVRLAVRLHEWANSGKALPETDGKAQLVMAGLDVFHPAGDRLRLQYRRMAANRFCVTVDPAGPSPLFSTSFRQGKTPAVIPRESSGEPLLLNKRYIDMQAHPTARRDKAVGDLP